MTELDCKSVAAHVHDETIDDDNKPDRIFRFAVKNVSLDILFSPLNLCRRSVIPIMNKLNTMPKLNKMAYPSICDNGVVVNMIFLSKNQSNICF